MTGHESGSTYSPNSVRCRYIRAELVRLDAWNDMDVYPSGAARFIGSDGFARTVDALAALRALTDLPDRVGYDIVRSAVISIEEAI